MSCASRLRERTVNSRTLSRNFCSDLGRIRRDRLYGWLTADPRVKCHTPGGAFYMLVDVSDVLTASGLKSSTEFAAALLEDAKVAVTPGESFGAPGLAFSTFIGWWGTPVNM